MKRAPHINERLNSRHTSCEPFKVRKMLWILPACLLFGLCFLEKPLFAAKASSVASCRTYFLQLDVYQSFSDAEVTALETLARSYSHAKNKSYEQNREVRAEINTQLLNLIRNKKFSAEMKKQFLQMFMELVDRLDQLNKSDAHLAVIQAREAKEKMEHQRQRHKRKSYILDKYLKEYGVTEVSGLYKRVYAGIYVEKGRINENLLEAINTYKLDLEIIELLIILGADVNYVNQIIGVHSFFKDTSLSRAGRTNNLELLELLMNAGARLEKDPLYLPGHKQNRFAESWSDQVFLFFLKNELIDFAKHTPEEQENIFANLVLTGKIQSLRFLLEKGFSLDWKNSEEFPYSPLIVVSHNLENEMLQLFLEYRVGAKFEEDLKEAVFIAIKWRDADRLKMLIQAGADINAVDSAGRTPLMLAAKGEGSLTQLEILIEAKADPRVVAKDGRTALKVAKQSVYYNDKMKLTVEMLKKYLQETKPDSWIDRGLRLLRRSP